MSILQEILTWSAGLPSWQSDAIARLLVKQKLMVEDLDDLFALLKTAHGIPDPKGRTPNQLVADQIPVQTQDATTISLVAIKNLKNVNAIAENQRLPIGLTGLTVIYGDNGSGKSGYSRVLKRACRARDQSEPIHPNVNLAPGKAVTATADFEILLDDISKDVHWTNGKPAPAELSALSIFDSRCARAYLDNEDDFSYVPYGLDIFEGLAKACTQLKGMLEIEQKQSATDITAFAHLIGDTLVGKLISGLSAKTSVAEVQALAKLTPDELARHTDVEKSLKEENPKEKANQMRLRARRFGNAATTLATKVALVDGAVVAKFTSFANEYRAAQVASELAAKNFKEGENLLPGSGGEVWRELFDAARKFAAISHPNKIFPDLGSDAACPLCQQPLAEGAARLLRFDIFIQEEAEKTVQSRRIALYDMYKPFVAQNMAFNIDESIYSEIESLDKQLAFEIRAFELTLKDRQETIKNAVISHNWAGTDLILESPFNRLQALVSRINGEAEIFEKASDENARIALQKQFDELGSRIRLNQVKEAVITAVSRLSHQLRLSQCLPDVKTTAISLKSSEIAEKVVSNDLAIALNREFKALGVGSLSVSLQSRSDKGKPLHKLKLELPQSRNPGEILSEGEQRAIAIGSFLAEVGLNGGKGGIVFDDPMSSLDHRRRKRVAKRLVSEASVRQVIVFTHDIYFLCILAEEAARTKVTITTQSLTKRSIGFGVADPELPFEGKTTQRRISALKAHQQEIAKLYRDGEEDEHRKQTVIAYFKLRMTWERAVEEVLLRNVVLRFRKGVETQRLKEVTVVDNDFLEVNSGMSKCSNYAHDKAFIGGASVPEPDELLADIMCLDNWRDQIERRSAVTAKQRKLT